MPSTVVTVDGFPATVDVSGPDKGSVVVMLGAAHQGPSAYDAVCQRLHTASLRTIVIAPDPRLSPKAVVGILDALDQIALHQGGDRAADGRLVGAGALGNVLRAAWILAKPERRQHAPFRNVEAIARLVLDGKRVADLGREPVEAERHESEKIESGQNRSNLS